MGDIQHKAKGQAMLSRKVYEQIAASVKKSVDKADNTLDTNLYQFAVDMASELADYFASDNPRFDRTRFFDACGLGGIHFRSLPVRYVDSDAMKKS